MTTLASEPRRWGITNEYAPLRDVLLGQPEFFRWIDAGPITMRTLNNQDRTGVAFNLQTAMSQHAEMVSIYESNGVACHYLDADEILHRNFFARDSSAMTPWGALICHMQLKSRRAHYVTAIRFYHNSDIPIWRYATAGHFEGGDFNILEPGLVLIGYCGERSEREGAEQVAGWVREQGWDAVVAPISREFVHMDGPGSARRAEAARRVRGRDGGMAGGAAARDHGVAVAKFPFRPNPATACRPCASIVRESESKHRRAMHSRFDPERRTAIGMPLVRARRKTVRVRHGMIAPPRGCAPSAGEAP